MEHHVLIPDTPELDMLDRTLEPRELVICSQSAAHRNKGTVHPPFPGLIGGTTCPKLEKSEFPPNAKKIPLNCSTIGNTHSQTAWATTYVVRTEEGRGLEGEGRREEGVGEAGRNGGCGSGCGEVRSGEFQWLYYQ